MRASRFYLWVLAAIVVGGVIGWLWPAFGVSLQPLGTGFIALIRMLIGPIIFLTVVLGIAGAGDVRKVGRVGIKAIVYFEVISTFALIIGLLVAHALQPGRGFNADAASIDPNLVANYIKQADERSITEFLLGIIPRTFVDAFVGGDLLQVLLLAVLSGVALMGMGERARPLLEVFEAASKMFFRIVRIIMWLAPLGAGGAMAFTVGRYGVESLGPLLKLMASMYVTCALFILLVLGAIARVTGFRLWQFLRYIREELLLVLGTSSSESALAPLMSKLERLGCPKQVVGLVVPSGYSFNLDGTNIYLTLAALFVAQAFNIELTWTQQLTLLLVAMLTSKGASGVTGAGFITLAATLAVVPTVPVAGLALILGVDRFMSEARSLTNFIGNGVATLAVSRWEGELDRARLTAELAAGPGNHSHD